MSGLSSAFISNRLAAEGTTAQTQQLILQYLNAVASAAALAGTEPQQGPIEDSPASGTGDQVRDYDIGSIVAQRILARRTALGGFSALTQLAGIKGFGADKFNDLLYSFTRCVHAVAGIVFNFNSASHANDALNLRRNFASTLPAPAWQRASMRVARDSCALYSIQATQGRPLAIRVALTANGLSAAYVRATGGAGLGSVREQLVSFDAAGDSGWQTFELDAATFQAHGVAALRSKSAPAPKRAEPTTTRGLGSSAKPSPLQQAFIDEQAAQCGYCINGMVMQAANLLKRTPKPSEAQIREGLAMNLCRCGSHQRIVRAVQRASNQTVTA